MPATFPPRSKESHFRPNYHAPGAPARSTRGLVTLCLRSPRALGLLMPRQHCSPPPRLKTFCKRAPGSSWMACYHPQPRRLGTHPWPRALPEGAGDASGPVCKPAPSVGLLSRAGQEVVLAQGGSLEPWGQTMELPEPSCSKTALQASCSPHPAPSCVQQPPQKCQHPPGREPGS